MEEDTVVAVPRPGSGVTDDPLLAVLREGARRMLAQAIEAEVEVFLATHAGLVDQQGRRRLVRNGHAPERRLQTGIGPVKVRRPKLRDRGGVADGGPIRFASAILPAYTGGWTPRQSRSGRGQSGRVRPGLALPGSPDPHRRGPAAKAHLLQLAPKVGCIVATLGPTSLEVLAVRIEDAAAHRLAPEWGMAGRSQAGPSCARHRAGRRCAGAGHRPEGV